MTKERLRKLVSDKLEDIYAEIQKDEGLRLGIKEGYVPVDMAIKIDKLTEYVTDHVDEIMYMNRHRQAMTASREENIECDISVIYDGINEDGLAFFNEVYPVDNLNKLSSTIEILQSKGFHNIAVEWCDEIFYLKDHTISEIENHIKEDIEMGYEVG